MKKLLLLPLILVGCGTPGPREGNESATASTAAPPQATASEPATPAAAASGLTGLYEGARTAQTDQLCMVANGGANEGRFGLVVWGADLHSCSGSGRAVRNGDRLTLTMSGDSRCEITAVMKGDTIAMPAAVPEGCAYYCGARARFAERTLTRAGDDALKARDLVGDPLCG